MTVKISHLSLWIFPCHITKRYLELRQAEDAQLRVRATTVEKLEEAIEQGVLVVYTIREAYLRVQKTRCVFLSI
jgi:hypothetical protein